MKGSYFIVSCGSYPQRVIVSVGQTNKGRIKAVQKYFPKVEPEPDEYCIAGSVGSVFQINAGHNFLLALNEFNNTSTDIANLVHEVNHIVLYIFRYVGNNMNSEDNDENFCYTSDYLVKAIHEKLLVV